MVLAKDGTSGNRKDLKCVVCGLSSVLIDSHVRTLLRKYCTVLLFTKEVGCEMYDIVAE